MGLFDNLANSIGGALGNTSGDQTGEGAKNILGNLLQQGGQGQSGGIIGSLLGSLGGGAGTAAGGGGMASMLETLAASGLGEQVTSWMSNQSNLPVTPQQIHDALGSQQVQDLAAKSGLPIGDFLKHLADHLPTAASEAAGTPTTAA